MRITFDPPKTHATWPSAVWPLPRPSFFEWATALIEEDTRKAYGELRYAAQGLIGNRLHVLVFTPREGNIHVISLRKANTREVKRYEKANQSRTS